MRGRTGDSAARERDLPGVKKSAPTFRPDSPEPPHPDTKRDGRRARLPRDRQTHFWEKLHYRVTAGPVPNGHT